MSQFMSVQVKTSPVRNSPNCLAPIIVNAAYGDQVIVREERLPWLKVTTTGKGIHGWMHSSALTRKKIIFKAGDANVKKTASQDEYALAGKGFNQDVENEFKKNNRNLNFSWVDKMETFRVSQQQMQQFLMAGSVKAKGGAV